MTYRQKGLLCNAFHNRGNRYTCSVIVKSFRGDNSRFLPPPSRGTGPPGRDRRRKILLDTPRSSIRFLHLYYLSSHCRSASTNRARKHGISSCLSRRSSTDTRTDRKKHFLLTTCTRSVHRLRSSKGQFGRRAFPYHRECTCSRRFRSGSAQWHIRCIQRCP